MIGSSGKIVELGGKESDNDDLRERKKFLFREQRCFFLSAKSLDRFAASHKVRAS